MDLKKEIINILKKETKLEEVSLEIPPDPKLGDYAFPCFALSKTLKKSPVEIAKELAGKIKPEKTIKEVKATGPYLNFFIDRQVLGKEIIKDILKKKDKFGTGKKKKDKIMVEYSQANTHKAFHVGHLRGTSLGESLARILKFYGYDVVQANYQGDTGAHVAKWMWCYLKFHNGEEPPKENPEKWIASIYVEAVKKTDEDTQKEIDEINYRLENSLDPKLAELWKKSRQWSLDSLELVYKDLDAHFDNYFFEREVEGRGRDISQELVKKGIAKIDEGATVVDLNEYGLGVWILLRKDGTCLYSAKDIALAERKFKEFMIDKSLYVVGAAQSLHLKQLFKTLELMKFKQAGKCYHLSFNEVRLPTGKMSSRTGENILYSELKEELLEKIKDEVEKRHVDWDKGRKEKSIKSIFSSAIKFDMIVQDPNKNIVFEIEKAMDFEGETGPYIQYAHARICSIIKKNDYPIKDKINADKLSAKEEEKVISLLKTYPDIIAESAEQYKPNSLARYLLELSQAFNEFYHTCPILQADEETKNARLNLILAVKQVLSEGLFLLGIESPEEM